MEAFEKMNIAAEDTVRVYVARLLENCIELGKAEYGRNLADKAKEKFGNDVVKSDAFQGSLRNLSKRITTKDEVRKTCIPLEAVLFSHNYFYDVKLQSGLVRGGVELWRTFYIWFLRVKLCFAHFGIRISSLTNLAKSW